MKSLCRIVCWAATLLSIAAAIRTRSLGPPDRLAIYYGYPSLVNGADGDLDRAVAAFSVYDIVVLGDGLEFDGDGPGHAGAVEHAFVGRLIGQLRRSPRATVVYGYVDLGNTQQLSLEMLEERLTRWAEMGATGVFFDEAGYDFGVTRERQNAAGLAARRRNLRVCFNAFQPADIFGIVGTPLNAAGGGNPSGVAPILTEDDAFLLESFAVRNGIPEPVGGPADARTRAAMEGRKQFGTRIFGVSTSTEAGDAKALASYGWWMATAFALDAYGWGTPAFSAATSLLPWMPRPPAEDALARAEYVGEIVNREGVWRRRTSAGTIVVDPASRTGTIERLER